MEKKTVRPGKKYQQMDAKASKIGGLAKELWDYAKNYYGGQAYSALWNHLTKIAGKSPTLFKTPEEFWGRELERAVVELTDRQFLEDMKGIVKMRMEGQFSASMWRRSYRSSDFGYHAAWAISELGSCLYLCGYDESIEELLYCEHGWIRGFDIRLAYEIRKGNQKMIDAVREAIYGDNQKIQLTSRMIRAIIISGNDELVEDLEKLLIAAKLQEGVRQQVLENADAGKIEILARFLKLCLDEDLFRYSSVIRAFATWTGLGYDNVKPDVVKKAAKIAYDCLKNENLRKHYVNSENNQEAYLALWAMGCHEIGEADGLVRRLLDDEKKYRRILGWLFISHTDNRRYQMGVASEYLEERDEEILAWIIHNLTSTRELMGAYKGSQAKNGQAVKNDDLPSDAGKRKELFQRLKEVSEFVGNKNRTFSGNPFEFNQIVLENSPVIRCMMAVAGYDMNPELVDDLFNSVSYMDVYQRRAYYYNFLQPETNLKHRAYLREGLNDRSIHVKELVVERLSKCQLVPEDMEAMTASLRSKSSDLRKSVLTVFREQKKAVLLPAIKTMLTSSEEYQIQAGIELLLDLKDTQPEMVEAQKENVDALVQKKLSTQTTILLEQLVRSSDNEDVAYTEENGFGLYDPTLVSKVQMPAVLPEKKKGFFAKLFAKPEEDVWDEKHIRLLFPTMSEYERILEQLNGVFERHANYEYEVLSWDGSRRKVLFGDGVGNIQIPAEYGKPADVAANKQLTMIPFHEEFIEALGEYATNVRKLIGLTMVSFRYTGDHSWSGIEQQSWFIPIENKGLAPLGYHSMGNEKYGQRYWKMLDVLGLLYQYAKPEDIFAVAFPIYQGVIRVIGEVNLGRNYMQKKQDANISYYSNPTKYPINYRPVGILRYLLIKTAKKDEDFRAWFCQEHQYEKMANVSVHQGLIMEDYFRACDMGLIEKDALYERLMVSSNADSDMRVLTNPVRWARGKEIFKSYDWAEALVKQAVNRVVEVESKRGELVTPLTKTARAIQRFEGAEYFCNLLAALGKENFFRGYEYSSDLTKKAILSRLLKRCYPSKSDTPEKLKGLLQRTDIKDKRLAEAVMYAPQWAGFAEKILGWPGLKQSVWFFHAHINEKFSAEKETEVAVYSPITPQQFNDGAFDKNWFFQAYEQMGEKKFQILYKSAKYITTGNSQHRRSQLYADAVLGKLSAEEIKAEVMDKRNQEKLRCYSLIPLDENHPEDALRRYEFIQKFLKESKQFGAQRRESEKKACNTAMENLAITMGLMDVNRMIWYLESEKIEEIRPMMEPKDLDGVSVWMEINEDGVAELAIEKKGKRQKTLPKTLNKNEWVLTLKDTIKELKEQQRRAKESLERAMVDSTEFGIVELEKICGNPVLSPMVSKLIWTTGNELGFVKAESGKVILCGLNHENIDLKDETLRVAHPHDFKQAGVWSEYMHLLYEREMKQPFKQVFREYYPLTEEERQEINISRRYAGHQVQPQKTVALLKGKGWTVDYEEGLQKVFYKENLIVRMYALADWFSPADIEAPTLEVIRFFDRKTGELVDLEKIPPIVFSETMRDIDLVVSVAHVGGVDPEASHSTVEMRTAIAKELVLLLRLANVEFLQNHAKIYGSLSNYSVHMGSGVIHSEGSGMIAVLPVHSQARGRIFLPFADDDPKTAEIMSKIILLSQDKKIKDASILRQI